MRTKEKILATAQTITWFAEATVYLFVFLPIWTFAFFVAEWVSLLTNKEEPQ